MMLVVPNVFFKRDYKLSEFCEGLRHSMKGGRFLDKLDSCPEMMLGPWASKGGWLICREVSLLFAFRNVMVLDVAVKGAGSTLE